MATAVSTPNIAFIKYWGNRNQELRLPAADSLSMTLDSPTVEVSIEPADTFSVHSEKELSANEIERFKKHLELTNIYLKKLNFKLQTSNFKLTIHSHIPPAIGLASSAAVFSAVAKTYTELLKESGIELTDEQTSVIARLGSGSAARSVMGGFVALRCHGECAIDSAFAVQVADENHWPLHDIVVCPSLKEKKHGSTEGHHLAHTSPHFNTRLKNMLRRQQECIDAILQRDFEKLQRVAEEDAQDLHKVAETSNPPLQYLNSETHRILHEIIALRTQKHLAVLYTMDAGPTVHLICTEDAVESVKDFAYTQKECTMFETKVGSGAKTRIPAKF
ncbi:diphosphomevalonate decarboxylase [Candidatus Peregrinibacteria bacterium]|nr:diphosphomevalonate decarboxylase [Candidatus Peregrinibacteria bacterium]